MQTWFEGSGLTAAAARRVLLDEARESVSTVEPGIEGQMGRCPGCGEDTALVRLDRKGRLIARCGHCFMAVYVGRDLGLPGFLKAFPDLAPIVLRIKSAQLTTTESTGIAAETSVQRPAGTGG